MSGGLIFSLRDITRKLVCTSRLGAGGGCGGSLAIYFGRIFGYGCLWHSARVIRVWFQNKRCKEKKKIHDQVKVNRNLACSGSVNNVYEYIQFLCFACLFLMLILHDSKHILLVWFCVRRVRFGVWSPTWVMKEV